jgi:hypothetical protein
MPDFKKYVVISNESGRLSNESWTLDRVEWKQAAAVQNLADYDGLLIDLAALKSDFALHIFDGPEIDAVFDLNSWAHILGSGGKIYIVGDPQTQVTLPASVGSFSTGGLPRRHAVPVPKHTAAQPLRAVLNVGKDPRPFDFRRIARIGESDNAAIYKYLDRAREWNYSLSHLGIAQGLLQQLIARQVTLVSTTFGHTTFSTCIAAQWSCASPKGAGNLVLLPSTASDPGADAAWVLREFLGIATAVPAPNWTDKLAVPEQRRLEKQISKRKETIGLLEGEIAVAEQALRHSRRWLRLLYDDGNSLEDIVKEAFEKLGGAVTKTSKEKDDYRLHVAEHLEAVMEVKGTHNAKFAIGSLRQLANWMDELIAEKGNSVKGIFVGNAGRTQPPTAREVKLFEQNNEKFAILKEIVIIRAMDLYCLVILATVGQLDLPAFWREFFDCKGPFDAGKYWKGLSSEYNLI